DMLAGDEVSEIAALLLVRAVAADLIDAEVRVGAIGEPDRGGRAGDFLHGNAVLEITEPCPTPFLLDRDAVHAELTQLGPEIAREHVAAIDFLGARRNAFSGKAAHALPQHVGRLAEAEIKAANVVYAHGHRSRMAAARSGCHRAFSFRLMHVLDRASNIARDDRLVRSTSAALARSSPLVQSKV